MSKPSYYRVAFMDIHSGQLVTLCYKSAALDLSFGMLRVADPWFHQSEAGIVVPKDMAIKERFSDCQARYIPMNFVLSIEEVDAPTEGKIANPDQNVIEFSRNGARSK